MLGLYAAAMPGPINLEVIRRTISKGPRLGLMFGLGATTADVAFVWLASIGALTLIDNLPDRGKAIMWLVGSVVLFIIGIMALRAKPPRLAKPMSDTAEGEIEDFDSHISAQGYAGLVGSYFLGLALTISSPPTIMFWVVTSLTLASTKMSLSTEYDAQLPYMLAAGVGCACCIWVSCAVMVASRFHRTLKPRTYVLVERVAGTALCGFAIYALTIALEKFWQS